MHNSCTMHSFTVPGVKAWDFTVLAVFSGINRWEPVSILRNRCSGIRLLLICSNVSCERLRFKHWSRSSSRTSHCYSLYQPGPIYKELLASLVTLYTLHPLYHRMIRAPLSRQMRKQIQPSRSGFRHKQKTNALEKGTDTSPCMCVNINITERVVCHSIAVYWSELAHIKIVK